MSGVIGLTGGIATGKSTVSAMLKELGAEVVDADQLAREAVLKGTPAFQEIVKAFPGVVAKDGELDRDKLGEQIFKDAAKRKVLNGIVHPRVAALALDRFQRAYARGAPVVVYDVPLLIENGLQSTMQGVILVTAPLAVQRERLMARNHLPAKRADQRIAAQLPREQTKKHATWIIDNGGTREATKQQVLKLWPKLQAAGQR